jgi:NADPH-dependent 2,4-dienoyl-CoA reductase/sulfur reductase-like enzyme/rhodanese-related sulfurtransferase
MPAKRIVVVGGTAAGPKAAARAKRLNQAAEVVLLQKAPELSMASCGYPYYVSGGVADRDQLLCTPAGVVRDPLFFAGAKGVKALVGVEALAVDRQGKTVMYRKAGMTGTESISYDKLILCTGSTPRMPRFPGGELEGITALHSMSDADRLREIAMKGKGGKAVIAGGGLIGMETCEALASCGMDVTVVEKLPGILAFLDPELSMLVENHVRSKGVKILTSIGVAGFEGSDGHVKSVLLDDGRALDCDLVVMALGVAPNVKLARDAGLVIGETGGIVVDAHMRTSDQDVYAAGDCVEVYSRLTGGKALAPYGDLANLEGRVAGENAAMGDRAEFPGTIFSGICKVFDFAAGSTGLSRQKALDAGYDVITVVNASPDKPGFMGAKLLVSKMIADAGTGRILGFQCVGAGEVNRQVAEAAMAVMAGMTVEEACMADLPYAPPFSLAIDHFIATAHILDNKMRGLLKGVSCLEVQRDLDTGLKPYFLDVRGPKEFEEMRLGIGEKLIPLGQLRSRLDELPADKNTMIVTYCRVSMRGYEAQRILEAKGYEHVVVMEGGIMAWPFAREK